MMENPSFGPPALSQRGFWGWTGPQLVLMLVQLVGFSTKTRGPSGWGKALGCGCLVWLMPREEAMGNSWVSCEITKSICWDDEKGPWDGQRILEDL